MEKKFNYKHNNSVLSFKNMIEVSLRKLSNITSGNVAHTSNYVKRTLEFMDKILDKPLTIDSLDNWDFEEQSEFETRRKIISIDEDFQLHIWISFLDNGNEIQFWSSIRFNGEKIYEDVKKAFDTGMIKTPSEFEFYQLYKMLVFPYSKEEETKAIFF
jgi:hypothetical protein